MKMDDTTEPDDAQTGESRWVYAFALCPPRDDYDVLSNTCPTTQHYCFPECSPCVRTPTSQSLARSIPTQLNSTPWPYSASELYRQSGRRRSAKLVPTFADRGVSRGQRKGSPRPLISVFWTRAATFLFK